MIKAATHLKFQERFYVFMHVDSSLYFHVGNYSRFSRFESENLVTRKIKWLDLEKLSKIAKIKYREISSFKNREIKLSRKFPAIR